MDGCWKEKPQLQGPSPLHELTRATIRARKGNAMSKRKQILDLKGQLGKKVRVTFQGGREVVGVLKGYDDMVNMVLEDCVEYLLDEATGNIGNMARNIPNLICRGPQVTLVAPEEGFAQISNPFTGGDDE